MQPPQTPLLQVPLLFWQQVKKNASQKRTVPESLLFSKPPHCSLKHSEIARAPAPRRARACSAANSAAGGVAGAAPGGAHAIGALVDELHQRSAPHGEKQRLPEHQVNIEWKRIQRNDRQNGKMKIRGNIGTEADFPRNVRWKPRPSRAFQATASARVGASVKRSVASFGGDRSST